MSIARGIALRPTAQPIVRHTRNGQYISHACRHQRFQTRSARPWAPPISAHPSHVSWPIGSSTEGSDGFGHRRILMFRYHRIISIWHARSMLHTFDQVSGHATQVAGLQRLPKSSHRARGYPGTSGGTGYGCNSRGWHNRASRRPKFQQIPNPRDRYPCPGQKALWWPDSPRKRLCQEGQRR